MNNRIEIIADVAGVKVGECLTKDQLETLVTTILHDMLHYVHHVDSGKYTDVHSAVDRIEQIVREGYGI